MRISDWSSDVCSSDLAHNPYRNRRRIGEGLCEYSVGLWSSVRHYRHGFRLAFCDDGTVVSDRERVVLQCFGSVGYSGSGSWGLQRFWQMGLWVGQIGRAHSELQSLMRISYAVFCLNKKI